MKLRMIEVDWPKLVEPIVISSLPGSAFVGKFAIDHIIADLHAKLLAEVFTSDFPSQTMVDEDGVSSLLKNEIYYSKSENGEHDIILFTGDAQPSTSESEYSLSEYLIDYLQLKYHVRLLITLGAYITGSYTNDPEVYATGTDVEAVKILEAAGCLLMQDGAITGMNGLLLGMARLKGLRAYSLLGETEGYAFDPRASEIVLETLTRLTGINIDLKTLRKKGIEALDTIRKIEQLNNEQGLEDRDKIDPRKKLDYIS
jgi:uncharacterized protein